MRLFGEIYNAFSLGYSIALVTLKHEDLKPIDIAFMAATAAFVTRFVIMSIVRFCNQCRLVPAEYQCTFFWKSLGRGLCYPLLWLNQYRLLFCCCTCCKMCLTFSNEAYDGVERTRQLVIFELDSAKTDHNLATHNLLRFEKGTWGYDRRVGDIWVRVSFAFKTEDNVYSLKLQATDDGTTSLCQYRLAVASEQNPGTTPEEVIGGGHAGDLERGSIPSTNSPTIPTPTDPYEVTITRTWGKYRVQQNECCPGLCPGCKRNLKPTKVQDWTLFQMHQYMLCLDAWGNHPKQGIWKRRDELTNEPRCSGCTYWCNYCSSNQEKKGNFRYCYRHDELIKAIGRGMRLKQTLNDHGTCFTVV